MSAIPGHPFEGLLGRQRGQVHVRVESLHICIYMYTYVYIYVYLS
jgi:hypothetical protein